MAAGANGDISHAAAAALADMTLWPSPQQQHQQYADILPSNCDRGRS